MRFAKKSRIIICTALFLTLSRSFVSYASTTYNYYIDNDDISGNYSNTRNGFNTYITGSSLYLNDARTQASGNSGYIYQWNLDDYSKFSTGTITLKLYAHLNHTSFTDPRAEYYAYTIYDASVGYLNQNLAPGGWNLIGTTYITPYPSTSNACLYGAYVRPSNQNGYTTAADGAHLTITL